MSTPPITQLCTFWADGNYFGVPVQDVQEVMRYQEMSAAPRAAPAVSGLINLRGQIVTAIDLRIRLGLPPRPAEDLPMNVVMRSRNEVVSLLVDDIGDVIDVGSRPVQPAPATLDPHVRAAVSGVLSLPEAILLLLDAELAADVVGPPPTTGDKS